jgi:hypothetical protein
MKRHSICVFVLTAVCGLAGGAVAQSHGSADRGVSLDKRLAGSPVLASRVQSLLPPGTSLEAASAGFTDEAEFLAALHVSRNLNLPFSELRADLARTKHESLRRALQDLRPELRSRGIEMQVKKAERQTQADLQFSGEVALNRAR